VRRSQCVQSMQRCGDEKLVSSVHRIIHQCSVNQSGPLVSHLTSELE
jgi:hypothetical protein